MIPLPEVTTYFTNYGFFFILIFGTIGNLFNLIVFTMRDFRTKPPILYLIYSTISSQIFISVSIIFRYTTEYNGNNLINTDVYICKIRSCLIGILTTTSVTYVVLAAFDRCISTSPKTHWRKLSSVSRARRICCATLIFNIIVNGSSLFVYGIHDGKCTTSPGFGTTIVNIYVAVFSISIPITGMCICGIMTCIHVKQLRKCTKLIYPSMYLSPNSRRMNRQMMILIFIHVLLSILIYPQRSAIFVYDISTASIRKNVERQQIEYLIHQVSLMLLYINHGVTFYLNYAFSKTFRKRFYACIWHSLKKWFGIQLRG